MPHIVIEYSTNLDKVVDIDALVAEVHAAAIDDGLGALDALRTRAAPRDHYRIADGDPAYGFVAVIARVGPGRSPDVLERFLTRVIDTVDETLKPVLGDHPVALSAEVQLIDPTMRINRNHIRTHLARGDRT